MLQTSVQLTSARKPKSPARTGPTHRRSRPVGVGGHAGWRTTIALCGTLSPFMHSPERATNPKSVAGAADSVSLPTVNVHPTVTAVRSALEHESPATAPNPRAWQQGTLDFTTDPSRSSVHEPQTEAAVVPAVDAACDNGATCPPMREEPHRNGVAADLFGAVASGHSQTAFTRRTKPRSPWRVKARRDTRTLFEFVPTEPVHVEPPATSEQPPPQGAPDTHATVDADAHPVSSASTAEGRRDRRAEPAEAALSETQWVPPVALHRSWASRFGASWAVSAQIGTHQLAPYLRRNFRCGRPDTAGDDPCKLGVGPSASPEGLAASRPGGQRRKYAFSTRLDRFGSGGVPYMSRASPPRYTRSGQEKVSGPNGTAALFGPARRAPRKPTRFRARKCRRSPKNRGRQR
jgi:hypothetical protein